VKFFVTRIGSIIGIIILCLLGCDNQNGEDSPTNSNAQDSIFEIKTYDGTNIIMNTFKIIDGDTIRIKSSVTFSQSDSIAVETEYYNNVRNGYHREWYISGQLRAEWFYVFGKLEGPYTFWYEDGQLWYSQFYKNDSLDSISTWYHEDGKLSTSSFYINGNLDGVLQRWNDSGVMTDSSGYNNGNLIGYDTKWDENGDLDRKYFYNSYALPDTYWYYQASSPYMRIHIYQQDTIELGNCRLYFDSLGTFTDTTCTDPSLFDSLSQ